MIQPLILYDLTRLVGASGRSAPTGVERVELAYARWLIGKRDLHVRFVVTMGKSLRLMADASVPAFLDAQARTWAEGAKGFSAAKAIENVNRFLTGSGSPPAPRLGYLSPEERRTRRERNAAAAAQPNAERPFATWAQKMAANWAGEPLGPFLRRIAPRRPVVYLRTTVDRLENPVPLEQLRAFRNVRIVAVCHDVIPLDYPEYCRPNAVALCRQRVDVLARVCDAILTPSSYSAARLASHVAPQRLRTVVAHLGIDAPTLPSPDLPPLMDRPYFLVVSTIEARKNHILLLHVWRRLAEELGPRTPRLVIVGKRGWEAQTPLAMLDRSRELSPYVYEAGAVPDEALIALRRRATAVLMPSFVEGFGMPLAEALAAGTPTIASDIPVFREIAGNAADLIDPLDGLAWRKAILDYAEPASPRRAAFAEAARRYAIPTWPGHFAQVDATLRQVIADTEPVDLAERARQALTSVAGFGYHGPAVATGRQD